MSVEKAFVISLPFREDRLAPFREATSRFQSIPRIEVWPAIHGDTCQPPESWLAGAGAWGCYRSHMAILEHCLNNRIGSYVVFEDDAQFRPGFDVAFSALFGDLPDDWQQVYLGGQLLHTHAHPTVKINANVLRPYNVNRTHAFIVSRAGMLPIYQWLSNLPFYPKEHIDHHLGRWHQDQRNAVYVPNRWLVGQHGSSSNVSGRVEPSQFYADPIESALNHWLYEKPVCVVFRGTRDVLQKCRSMLHAGNTIDANGYDVTLSVAAKYADPVPEIERWFSWIRGEIVRSNSLALPCLFHPRITTDMLAGCKFKTIVLDATTVEDVKEFHANFRP